MRSANPSHGRCAWPRAARAQHPPADEAGREPTDLGYWPTASRAAWVALQRRRIAGRAPRRARRRRAVRHQRSVDTVTAERLATPAASPTTRKVGPIVDRRTRRAAPEPRRGLSSSPGSIPPIGDLAGERAEQLQRGHHGCRGTTTARRCRCSPSRRRAERPSRSRRSACRWRRGSRATSPTSDGRMRLVQ